MSEPNDLTRSLPIAEHFHSLQGEGQFAGTPMHFIRLAGCSVGKLPSTNEDRFRDDSPFPILKTGANAWECHTYDGRAFWCDTDFNLHERLSFDLLLDDTWEGHICITGGEPLIHKNLPAFVEAARSRDIYPHIETSGTIFWDAPNCWVSVSPKYDYLPDMIVRADELKLLVDDKFDIGSVPVYFRLHSNVFVQPVNFENAVDFANVDRCLKILRILPHWRLSVQLHKFLGMR